MSTTEDPLNPIPCRTCHAPNGHSNRDVAAACRGATEPAWAEPLRTELRALVDAPWTPASLKKVSDFALKIKGLVALSTGAPDPKPRGLGAPWLGLNPSSEDDDAPAMADTFTPVLTNPGVGAETFGAKVIREALAVAAQLKGQEGVPGLVRALRDAKEAGLAEVIPKLQARLDELLGADEPRQTPPLLMTPLQEALEIFSRYCPGANPPLQGEHDELYMCVDPARVPAIDRDRLNELGWEADDDLHSFMRHTSA